MENINGGMDMRLRFIGNCALAIAIGILGEKGLETAGRKILGIGKEIFKKKVHEAVAEKE